MAKISKINKPVWLKYNEAEVKEIIASIIKKNPELTSEKIGLILRDNYGIPKTKIYGFKISQILKELNAYKNSELENIKKKIEKLETHITKNKKDRKTKRSLMITKARFKKINDYLAENKRE